MLAGKKLPDFTNLFYPYDFDKNDHIILSYFKNEWKQFIEAIDKTNLTNQTNFWLGEISEIKNYFIEQINQGKSCSKQLSKYIAVFDYIDQALIVLSATSGGVSIISLTSIVGEPVEIASASITSFFSITTGIVKKLLNITRN